MPRSLKFLIFGVVAASAVARVAATFVFPIGDAIALPSPRDGEVPTAEEKLLGVAFWTLLTLIAFYAPAGHRATWFALMASLMNMALVAGQLQTKYLNEVFVVQRGEYSELGPLLIIAALLGFILPIGAILLFGRRA